MADTNASLIVFCGPMMSGKTSKLLMALERLKYQHKRVAVFKPSLDVRYSASEIVSHLGWRHPATTVQGGADILEALAEADVAPDAIAVDEAFMIPGVAGVLTWLYRTGVDVVVSTLDISATGKPFPEVEKLLPWATHIEKCSAVCTQCGRDAFYTHKKQVSTDDEIEVGGAEMYEPRCSRHHVAIDLRPKLNEP